MNQHEENPIACNQKAVYHKLALAAKRLEDDEISVEKAVALGSLYGKMTSAFAQEVKIMIAAGKAANRAPIESTAFDDTTGK